MRHCFLAPRTLVSLTSVLLARAGHDYLLLDAYPVALCLFEGLGDQRLDLLIADHPRPSSAAWPVGQHRPLLIGQHHLIKASDLAPADLPTTNE